MDRKWPMGISFPSTLPLPSTTLLPSSHPIVHRTLNRLTRSGLLSLALDWLSDINQFATAPYLLLSPDDTINDLFPPASSLKQLRRIYNGLEERGGTKRDVLERILEGDWRHGISLYALAMADMQFLYSHPSSQNWLAWEISPLFPSSSDVHAIDRAIPCFQPSIFLRNMQHECLPDIKVHYNIDRHDTLPLSILRVWILETPYNSSFSLLHTAGTFLNNSIVFYIAFPDFSPYVYISSSSTLSKTSFSPISKAGGSKSLRKLVIDAIPKAYSKPGERYRLRNTNFSAKSLEAIIEHRGNGRMNSASAAWATYAETHSKEAIKDNPLDTIMASYSSEISGDSKDEKSYKKPKIIIKSKMPNHKHKSDGDESQGTLLNRDLAKIRFGSSALPNDGKGIERLYIRFEDPFPNHSISPIIPLIQQQNVNRMRDQEIVERNKSIARAPKANKKVKDYTENKIWRPEISLVFTGSHVFAGIRELVEYNIIDGLRMPGWMTGEQGISEGVIRNGRIVNYTKS